MILLILLLLQCLTFGVGNDMVNTVLPKEHPYVVSIGVARQTPKVYITGVLIHHNWALTAAHCVWHLHHRPNAHRFYVKAGTVTPRNESRENVQKRFVSRVVFHYMYSPNSTTHDLALLNTKTPFNVDGENLKTIRLSEKPFPQDQLTCVVLGYGLMSSDVSQQVGVLRSVYSDVGDYNHCTVLRGNHTDTEEQFLCTSYKQVAAVARECFEDSGRVVVCSGTLAGFWVRGCQGNYTRGKGEMCDEDQDLMVFVFVGEYYPWVKYYVHNVKEPVTFQRSDAEFESANVPLLGNHRAKHSGTQHVLIRLYMRGLLILLWICLAYLW